MTNTLRITIDDRNFRTRLPKKIRDIVGSQDPYVIRSQNPKSNRLFPNTGAYPNFDLPRWLHEFGGVFQTDNPFGKAGKQHVPERKARYMFSARDHANLNKTQWAKQFIKTKSRGGSLTRFIAERTRDKAKEIAPKRSGALVSLIKIFKGKK